MSTTAVSYFGLRPRSSKSTRLHAPNTRDVPPVTPSDISTSSLYPSDDSSSEGDAAAERAQTAEAVGAPAGFVDPFPDFKWMTTEEPHRSRRMAILKAHPEVSLALPRPRTYTKLTIPQVRKLMGPTRWTLPVVLVVLGTQLALAYHFRNSSPLSWAFVVTAYVVGGTLNQNTFLAIHEITHNLAFKSIRANKCLAIVSNLAIGVPYAMAFKGYHIEHHKFLGEDGIDTDLPSRIEAVLLNNVAGKTFFA